MLKLIRLEWKKNNIRKYLRGALIRTFLPGMFVFALAFWGIANAPDGIEKEEIWMATIDLIVLRMLKKESLSAYDIQKLVEYRNISKWVKISTPSIYKKVLQLEEKGLIRGHTEKEGPKRASHYAQRTWATKRKGGSLMQGQTVHIVSQAIRCIEDNLHEKLDLDMVAAALHYSKYHLHWIFTKTIGLTVHDYAKRRQLTEAAKLLVFSKKPIIEIAFMSGYESQQAFTDIFKAMYKTAPAEFRETEYFYPLQLEICLKDWRDGKSSRD